jgi:hypothetical protein
MCPVFGKVALADAFGLERLLTGRTAFLDGVGGQLEQDLTGEGAVLRVQRREQRRQPPVQPPHLSRDCGLVTATAGGRRIRYDLADPRLSDALHLLASLDLPGTCDT